MKLMNILKYGPGERGRRRKREKMFQVYAAQFAELGAWANDGALARRNYASYADYLAHQAQKLDGVAGRLKEREPRDLAQFKRRFQSCPWLGGARTVLCLGARLGTEVCALRELGHFAVGIDLNPGPQNTSVMYGDFHNIAFPDASADAIYTNALDHTFDLDRLIGEVHRVLRPDGVFVADVTIGFDEGYPPGEFESLAWSDTATLIERWCESGQFTVKQSRGLAGAASSLWQQVVFGRVSLQPVSRQADEPQPAAAPTAAP